MSPQIEMFENKQRKEDHESIERKRSKADEIDAKV